MSREAMGEEVSRYDELVARLASRETQFVVDELAEELTEASLPSPDDLTEGGRFFLWITGGVLSFMALAGFIANPVAGFLLACCCAILWFFMISATKEIVASAEGAGNMYRLQKIGRNPKAAAVIEQRREALRRVTPEPRDLLKNLDDPAYVRTLKEALRRDEQGWTMSN